MKAMQDSLLASSRFKAWEPLLWLLAFAAPWVVPGHALIVNEIAIVALFALSLDLILGYAGVVSLGHAAFFGFGAYTAALFAKLVMPDPVTGLLVGMAGATVLGAVCSLTILRGSDLTRLMVTLGMALILLELANKLDWLTGGSDGLQGVVMGPVLGRFEFDLMGQTAAWYSLSVLLGLFLLARRWVHSPLGATLKALRDNPLRAMAIGINVQLRLAVVYTVAAGVAGAAGALLFALTHKGLGIRRIYSILVDSALVSAMMIAIVFGAAVFVEFINLTGIHRVLESVVTDSGLPPFGIVLIMIAIFFVAGALMEELSMILILVPIFFPVIIKLGYDPVWFGIIVVVACEIGLIAPPIGMNLFVIRSVAPEVPMNVILSGMMPFITVDLLRIVLLAAFPAITLWLPNLLF